MCNQHNLEIFDPHRYKDRECRTKGKYHKLACPEVQNMRPADPSPPTIHCINITLDERYLLYEADNCPHLLWPWGDAITLLVLVDNDTVKKKLKEQKARKLPIESQMIEEIKDTGYILLRPGMAILLQIVKTIQDKGLDADTGNDNLQGWVTDKKRRLGDDSISDDLMERMARIMEDISGLADERSDSPPSRKNVYTGGIAFEWHLYTRNAQPFNSQGKGCYSIGYTVEKQAALMHPSKNMQYNPVIRMDDNIRIGLLNVATEYSRNGSKGPYRSNGTLRTGTQSSTSRTRQEPSILDGMSSQHVAPASK
ncbi:hypothetical protein GLOTRDRAFT_92449 [Gloeophyllum trabeum ATCC 11539]|uniref:Uncharacterized protein n=1 Tax=Gloeophyllum trabeum (strain ATCC 11539 / FP-39264 / Madison 617) TaxID=670483 RepID=S7QDK9_GLOTA|nr:uncharacterized protein GLOTRDRAFT_92449 [Gloeophyllum trabeum ATCC 11539]EPQ57412.1 hypothetical protein GLOTRDRAFT_92449 [Gloeophyllum trabeum ATCC 11539]